MFKKGLTVLFLMFLCCSSVLAAEWKEITDTNINHYRRAWIDLNSIKSKGNIVTVWDKTSVFCVKRHPDAPNFEYSSYKTSFACGKRLQKRSFIIHYDKNDKIVSSGEIPNSNWEEVVPETYSELLYNLACDTYNPKKKKK